LCAWGRNHHHIWNPIEYGATYISVWNLWEDSLKAKVVTLMNSIVTFDFYYYNVHFVNQDCINIIMGYLNN
jgi:hypothetical protein